MYIDDDGIRYTYRPGDVVRIRRDLVVGEYYGSPYNDDTSCWYESMTKFAGQTATIASAQQGWYDLKEDGMDDFCWNDDMFEPVDEDCTNEVSVESLFGIIGNGVIWVE